MITLNDRTRLIGQQTHTIVCVFYCIKKITAQIISYMVFIFDTIIILIICIFLIFLYHFLHKNDNICRNSNNLHNLYKDKKIKIYYAKLKTRRIYKPLNKIVLTQKSNLFCQKSFDKNKNYILTLSKFIDYKLLNNKQKYRSKGTLTLVENLTKIMVYDFKNSYSNNLFFNYKQYLEKFSLKQKEIKIFKLLIGRELILYLSENLKELNEISKIIQKSKNAKTFKRYKNLLHNYAEYYGISKFNNKSNMLKNNISIVDNEFKNFFSELFYYDFKIRQIVSYLEIMFN